MGKAANQLYPWGQGTIPAARSTTAHNALEPPQRNKRNPLFRAFRPLPSPRPTTCPAGGSDALRWARSVAAGERPVVQVNSETNRKRREAVSTHRQEPIMTTTTPIPPGTRDAIAQEDLSTLRSILEGAPLARHLGITFTDFHPGHAEARMPASAALPNFLGYAHTGALFTLAEQTMAAAANSLGYVGLPLSCDIQFLKGGDPERDSLAVARVVDTQGRIARVQVEILQEETLVLRLSEMVFLRSGSKG